MITFFKYNSCGNDFIIIDNRDKVFSINNNYIKKLCDRHLGIGADGLILLEDSSEANYFMNYFNSDGFIASFCGNGNLCCGHFAHHLDMLNKKNQDYIGTFATREGVFNLQVGTDSVSICMPDITNYNISNKNIGEDLIINTGSPHCVIFQKSIHQIDVNQEGRVIRNSKLYREEGINVTFVSSSMLYSIDNSKICDFSMIDTRTYERGVESETLSCGTGVVAAALSEIIYYILSSDSPKFKKPFSHSTKVTTMGGLLLVQFTCDYKKNNNVFDFSFSNIVLSNKVNMVFQGQLPF